MEHKVEILFLSKQEVDALIDWEDIAGPVEEVFRCDGEGQLVVPNKDPIMMEDGRSMLLAMPGYLKPASLAGMKWMRSYPYRPNDLPQLWAQLILLSDAQTGLPTAILDGTTITSMRTAGGHAVVAAKYLMKPGSKTLGVLGCGAQARSGIPAFDRQFELEDIVVYAPEAKAVEEELRAQVGPLRARLSILDSAEEVCRASDILLTVTSNHDEPIIKFEWLKKGCFIDSMTSFFDIGPEFSKLVDKWMVGHRVSDRSQIIQHPTFAGKLDENDVYGTLGEVVSGKLTGRETDDDIILYTHMGMGPFDIAVAQKVCEKAQAADVGTMLRLS